MVAPDETVSAGTGCQRTGVLEGRGICSICQRKFVVAQQAERKRTVSTGQESCFDSGSLSALEPGFQEDPLRGQDGWHLYFPCGRRNSRVGTCTGAAGVFGGLGP